jgi:hypothetical protein
LSFESNPGENTDAADTPPFGSFEKCSQVMREVSQLSRVEISFNTKLNAIELFGTEKQVKEAYKLLTNIPVIMVNLFYKF